MIKLIQLKKGAHKVIALFNKFILKYYSSLESLERDISGIKSWQRYAPDLVPKVYFRLGRLVVFEFIKAENGSDFLTIDIIKVFKYFFGDTTGREQINTWVKYLKGLEDFYRNSTVFTDYLPKDIATKTELNLNWLIKVDWAVHKLFPLHRDLCWSNALATSTKSFRVIDFEHSLIGPIEYEFANSVFWKDEMSLDIGHVLEIGQKEGLHINMILINRLVIAYFIDQIRIAITNNDLDKVQLLVNKYLKFVKDNNYLKPLPVNQAGTDMPAYEFLH